MQRQTIPVTLDAIDGWEAGAPDPLANPALYDGMMIKRVLAYLVDVAIILVLLGIVWLVFAAFTVMSFGLLSPLLWPSLPLIPLAYHTFFIGGERSATLGMQAFNIEVRAWNGRRPSYLQALLVTVVFYLSVGLTGWLILIVSLFNDRRRTLHDLLCGTVVVNAQAMKS